MTVRIDGVTFCRAGRDDLAREAERALERGDRRAALALLLADQDDWAPVPPPPDGELRALIDAVDAGAVGLEAAMAALGFGPVAGYFEVRPSAPTFLSALGLLEQHGGPAPARVVDVACGLGQVLVELARWGVPVVGVDVVFAKLWLARRFLLPQAPQAPLLCADIAAGPLPLHPVPGSTVLCHDALYFVHDQEGAAEEMTRLAGAGGRVLVGHAHLSTFDHGGVAGHPRTAEGWAALVPGARLYDDAAFVQPGPVAEGPGEEAVSLVWGDDGPLGLDLRVPPPGTPLVRNPLLERTAAGWRPAWPAPQLAAEYPLAERYLRHDGDLPATAVAGSSPAVDALARRRLLLAA